MNTPNASGKGNRSEAIFEVDEQVEDNEESNRIDMRARLLLKHKQSDKMEIYKSNPLGIDTDVKREHMKRMLKIQKGNKNLAQFKQLETVFNHNPSLMFSARGRLMRWLKDPEQIPDKTPGCCGVYDMTDHEHDLLFVHKLEQYENKLHEDLDARTRAINNWKKLRLLLIIL